MRPGRVWLQPGFSGSTTKTTRWMILRTFCQLFTTRPPPLANSSLPPPPPALKKTISLRSRWEGTRAGQAWIQPTHWYQEATSLGKAQGLVIYNHFHIFSFTPCSGLFFRFWGPNSNLIFDLTQANFKSNSLYFSNLTQNFGNFSQIIAIFSLTKLDFSYNSPISAPNSVKIFI